MSIEDEFDQLSELENQYRICSCRSTTPFFSSRKNSYKSPHIKDSKGNITRTKFQHDRDKILYSHSFRRLKLKTQIFPEHASDYLRTRLDHTLEVSQISRHLARQLKLNEDLLDALSLAHDIGHTPFGHSGERALHKFLTIMMKKSHPNLKGFKHNWQGLRIVDKLENLYPQQNGLDLTNAVRIGILLHTNLSYKNDDSSCDCDMSDSLGFDPSDKKCNIFEIQVLQIADEIAQVIHDLEDAFISGEIQLEEVIRNKDRYPVIKDCIEARSEITDIDPFNNSSLLITRLRSELLWQLTTDIIESTKPKLEQWEQENLIGNNIKSKIEAFNSYVESDSPFPICVELDAKKTDFEMLSNIIEEKLVNSERINRMDGKADYCLHKILEVYLTKPKQVPTSVLDQFGREIGHSGNDLRMMNEDKLKSITNTPEFVRRAVDFVAGMTDRFSLKEFDQLYSAYPRSEL